MAGTSPAMTASEWQGRNKRWMLAAEMNCPAVVIGASGGIGAALVAALAAMPGRPGSVLALSRRPVPAAACVVPGRIDIADEASIAAAARMAAEHGPPGLVIVATGALHQPGGNQPEKSWRALDADALLHAYQVNAVGPALVAKHFLPLLPRHGRSVFAALSARVGSIGDNRLGGWHAYRASKAALNMLLRNLAIELARGWPEAICVGPAPGHGGHPAQPPVPGQRAGRRAVHAGSGGRASAARARRANTDR